MSGSPPRRRRRPDSLLANRGFLGLWLSNLFFFSSTWMLTQVLGWLVFEETQSGYLLGLFGVFRTAPLLLGPLAGVLADRLNRVTLLMALSGLASAAIAGVAITVANGHGSVGLYLFAGLAVGLAHSPSQPPRMALVTTYVTRDQLSRANALNTVAANLTQVFGPTIGSLLMSSVSNVVALSVAVAFYLASVLALAPLRRGGATVAPADRVSVYGELVEGLRVVRGSSATIGLLVVTVFANLLIWPVYQTLMPMFGARANLGPNGMSLLLTSSGLGGLAGALVIARLGKFHYVGKLFIWGTFACALSWTAFTFAERPWLGIGLMFVVGFSGASFMVLQATILLLAVPEPAQGRAFGFLQLGMAFQPLGALALGFAADWIGATPTVAASSLLLAGIIVVVGLRSPALLRIG